MAPPRPEPVGSGGMRLPPPPTAKFPNNTELVSDREHAHLLAALLPALQKYNCLLFSKTKPRRSPWVRAFCDLYHPAGPWGKSKFNHNTDITSPKKYNFKSYQIPTIFKQLKKYEEANKDSAVHVALLEALEEYYSKEEWYKAFIKGCEECAAVEVNKPLTERAAIPKADTGLIPANVAAANHAEAGQASNGDKQSKEAKDDQSDARSQEVISTRRRKRNAKEDEEEDDSPPCTRRRLMKEKRYKDNEASEEAEEDEEEEVAHPRTRTRSRLKADEVLKESEASEEEEEFSRPRARRRPKAKAGESKVSSKTEENEEQSTPPPSPRHTKAKDEENHTAVTPDTGSKKDSLEKKRVQLVDLLAKREHASGGNDVISKKIQVQIDKIDEELLEMILA